MQTKTKTIIGAAVILAIAVIAVIGVRMNPSWLSGDVTSGEGDAMMADGNVNLTGYDATKCQDSDDGKVANVKGVATMTFKNAQGKIAKLNFKDQCYTARIKDALNRTMVNSCAGSKCFEEDSYCYSKSTGPVVQTYNFQCNSCKDGLCL
ncbi:MAG: hypothetical protein NTZ80_02345 [Patescibacteria group bacterium]|nr:hypothetical protein [Patescibacteria group bacterium]